MFNDLDITEERLVHKLTSDDFHNLCRDFLIAKYQFHLGKGINEFGKAIAKNKPKSGTPDVYFINNYNEYIFCEFTTQEECTFDKLKGDLTKCIESKQKGVPVVKVILVYIGQILNPKDESLLREIASQNIIDIEIFSKDQLKYELTYHFQDLRLKYLSIPKDSHVIFSIDAFKEKENGNKFSTPLNERFYGRSQELLGLSNVFQYNDILVVSGPAGVGKTHFSLELLRNIKDDYQGYEILVISSFGTQFELKELQQNFRPNLNVILLIDDANRYLNIDSFINYFRSVNINFRMIFTVRDTNLGQIISFLKESKHKLDFLVEEFTNPSEAEIEAILTDIGIPTSSCLHNIIRVSNQNPRLALMIGNEVLKRNDCNALGDIIKIYSTFYESNLGEFTDSEKLGLALISFFHGLNSLDYNLITFLENDLHIKNVDFFGDLIKMDLKHKILVIMPNKEGYFYKLPDQNIMAYFFCKYLVFENGEVLTKLLFKFGITFHGLVNDSLGALKTYFGYRNLQPKLHKIISSTLELFGTDIYQKAQFISYYSEFIPNESYLFIANNFEKIDSFDNRSIPAYVKKNPIYWKEYNVFLRISDSFEGDSKALINMIGFVVEYHASNKEQRSGVIELLKKVYFYHQEDFFDNYSVQRELLEHLIDDINDNSESRDSSIEILEQIAGLFLKIIAAPCKYRLNSLGQIHATYVGDCEELLGARKLVWQFLIIGIVKDFRKYYSIFKEATEFHFEKIESQLLIKESTIVLKLMEDNFNPNRFSQNFVFHSYCNLVCKSKEKVSLDIQIIESFKTPIFENFQILSNSYFELPKKRQKRVDNNKIFFARVMSYTVADFQKLYIDLIEIIDANVGVDTVNENWSDLLLSLSTLNTPLLIKLLQLTIENGNSSNVSPHFFLPIWLDNSNDERDVFNLLAYSTYKLKGDWLWYYFMVCEQLDTHTYKRLLKCVSEEPIQTIQKVEGIERYELLKKGAFIEIFSIISKKEKWHLESSFFEFSERFLDNKRLLFDIYIKSLDKNYDFQLLNFKRVFVIYPDLLDWVLKKLYRHGTDNILEKTISSSKDLGFLRNDYKYFSRIITHSCIYDDGFMISRKLLEKLLKVKSVDEEELIIEYFNEIIKKRIDNGRFVNKVFNTILEYVPSIYYRVFKTLFDNEIQFSVFRQVPIHKITYFYNPKYVNYLAKNEQDFIDRLIELIPKGFKYNKYRTFLTEKKIYPRFQSQTVD